MVGLSGFTALGSWCRGLTCLPVTEEIAGSNPVEPAKERPSLTKVAVFLWEERQISTVLVFFYD